MKYLPLMIIGLMFLRGETPVVRVYAPTNVVVQVIYTNPPPVIPTNPPVCGTGKAYRLVTSGGVTDPYVHISYVNERTGERRFIWREKANK